MNRHESIPYPVSVFPWRRVLLWGAIAIGLSVAVVAAAVVNVVTLNRDAGLMRNEIFAVVRSPTTTQVQFSVGPALLGAARLGVIFCEQIPREARLALGAVQEASVGVYRLSHEVDMKVRSKMFAATDKRMTERGWTRVVGVNDPDAGVMIYMPADGRERGPQRVCLAVCQRDHVVIVAASCEADKLAELATSARGLARL